MMKKRMIMITAAAITAAVCCPVLHASAEEAPFADAEALYESWEDASEPGEDEYYSAAGYPDYVCGVWTDTGETDQLVIGLVPGEAGEKGRAEILSLIEDDSSVSFVTQEYPYAKLTDIMNDMTSQMDIAPDFYSCWLDDEENRVVAEVNLESPSPELNKLMEYYTATYGAAAVFEQGSPVMSMTEDGTFTPDYDPEEYDALTGEYWEIGAEDEIITADGAVPNGDAVYDGASVSADGQTIGAEGKHPTPDNRRGQPMTVKPALQQSTEQNRTVYRVLWIASAVILLTAAGVAFVILRRRSAARQTNAGTVQTAGGASRKQTEQLVRENAPELPENLKERVLEKVKQETAEGKD